MVKTLLIRADANTRMGTGHVMRCIALGQAWQDAGGEVIFVSCCDSDVLKQRIKDEGFELVELSQAYPQDSTDLTKTLGVSKEYGVKWIVTDGYHFDLDYQQSIRRAGFKLLYVDDYNHLSEYEADILLNQNIGAEEIEYRCNPECRKLLGIRCAMLRREFRQVKSKHPASRKVKNILVTMGGADPNNATLDVLQALPSVLREGIAEVRVVVGPSNPHRKSLEYFSDSSDLSIVLLESVKDMPALIQWADFAISAAGSTCWELAVMNVPFATVIIADNQVRIAHQLEEIAGVPTLGWSGLDFEVICKKVLRSFLSKIQDGEGGLQINSIIDSFGIDRILFIPTKDSGLNILRDRLALRLVSKDDIRLLFEWANDSVTRKNSFNSELIAFENHLNWFEKRIGNPNVCMFILEIDGVPCGHIRYELDEVGDAVLSFVVSPFFRGMGIGQKLVELSRGNIIARWNCRIKAQVLSTNRASSRIFEKTGFLKTEVYLTGENGCCTFYWGNQKNEG